MSRNDPVSIVLPIYKERREIILSTLKDIAQAMKKSGIAYEIIAVSDGVPRTTEILNKVKGIKTIEHPHNKGYGASIKTGIKNAKYDWIMITDTDGTYPNKDMPKLLEHRDKYDMVIGKRSTVNVPFIRKPAKLFLLLLANYISDYHIPDINSGFRVFRKEIALKYWNLFPSRFSFTTTITLSCTTDDNYNVKYIPIHYFKRKGKSTIKPSDFLRFLNLTFKICFYFKPLKVFIPTGFIFFILGVIIGVYQFFGAQNVAEMPVLLVLSGIQILFLGFIAELLRTR